MIAGVRLEVLGDPLVGAGTDEQDLDHQDGQHHHPEASPLDRAHPLAADGFGTRAIDRRELRLGVDGVPGVVRSVLRSTSGHAAKVGHFGAATPAVATLGASRGHLDSTDMSSDDAAATPETDRPAEDAASHDIPMAKHLQQAVAADWDPAPPMPHPARPDIAPYAAKRRSELSAAYPGALVVVPAGPQQVRANDTDYAFRASSAFTWATGETVADAVFVMTPTAGGHHPVLYVREFAQPGEVAYFTSRTHGAVWVGNVPTVADTEQVLGLETRPLSALAGDLAAHRDGRSVLLSGVDESVDALLPAAEATGLAQAIDEQRLVKDEWELGRLRHACEITARGFADVARELPAVIGRDDLRGERWLEGTFWRRARLEGNEVGYTSIVGSGRHGTTLHWWRNHGSIAAGDLLLADMGVEDRRAVHRRRHPHDAGRRHLDAGAAQGLPSGARGAGCRDRRGAGRQRLPGRARRRDVRRRRAPARVGHPAGDGTGVL